MNTHPGVSFTWLIQGTPSRSGLRSTAPSAAHTWGKILHIMQSRCFCIQAKLADFVHHSHNGMLPLRVLCSIRTWTLKAGIVHYWSSNHFLSTELVGLEGGVGIREPRMIKRRSKALLSHWWQSWTSLERETWYCVEAWSVCMRTESVKWYIPYWMQSPCCICGSRVHQATKVTLP